MHFTQGVFNPANPVLRDVLVGGGGATRRKALIVVDEALAKSQPGLERAIADYFATHGDALELVRSPIVVEGGERVKNSYFHVSEIHSQIDRYHIDRHAYLLCVGGGALLDMVGLAASTAHRGIRHVRIPTTTLSQDDSGVGVKNGVNAFGKKNFIGTFCPPFAVINDFQLLATLSARDKRAGYVEAVKVACIRDAEFFASIERDAEALAAFEPAAMQRLIYRCAELHLNHIATSGDAFEFGSARPLDFGHWAAHKLEQLSEFRVSHGEAVAVGMAIDLIYARRTGLLPEAAAERILGVIRGLGFELFAPVREIRSSSGRQDMLDGLEEFREHLGGRLTIPMIRAPGDRLEVHEMDGAVVKASFDELRTRYG